MRCGGTEQPVVACLPPPIWISAWRMRACSMSGQWLERLLGHSAARVSPGVAGGRPVAANRLFRAGRDPVSVRHRRSEEHTSELPSLIRNPYDVFWLEKK